MFYVYAHYTLDTNELFYVGKGTKKRAHHIHGRNSYWNRIVKKHGYKVEILIDNLSAQDALIQEILGILEYKPKANLTSGGEGSMGRKGWKHSLQTIEKITKHTRSRSNAWKIDSTKHPLWGKTQSHISKIKNASSNGQTPFYAIDRNNNKFGPFFYKKQAAEILNIPASSNISSCLNGKIKSYKGFKFERLKAA